MILAVVLFIFWVILSGKFDAFHLSLGAMSSVGVAYWVRDLNSLPPSIQGFRRLSWTGWPTYLPWLVWQIVLSAVAVAKVVLDPKLPIEPKVIKFKCKLPHTVAHLTLANSITLTPGTITIDQTGDAYVVHALTTDAGDGLIPKEGEGEMQVRVRNVFKRYEELG